MVVLTLNALAAPGIQPAVLPDKLPLSRFFTIRPAPDLNPTRLLFRLDVAVVCTRRITLYPDPQIAGYPTQICAAVVNNDQGNAIKATTIRVANLVSHPLFPNGDNPIDIPPNDIFRAA